MIAFSLMVAVGALGTPDQVVVYPDRAQVTRVAKVTCGARVPLLFEAVPPSAAADSFRARVTDGSIDGLRAELITQTKEFAPKAEALQKQLEALGNERQAVDDEVQRLTAQTELSRRLANVTATMISDEMARERPDLKAWQQALDSATNTALSAARALAETNQRRRELARKHDELSRQLQSLQLGTQKKSYSVEVLVSCTAPTASADVSLTYLVGGASWTPVYEARVEEGAVDFSTYATLEQATGEDWSNVELVLSTAVPVQNATPPEPRKLMLSSHEKAVEQKVLVRRDEVVARAQSASSPSPAVQKSQVAAANQGLSVQLRVPEKTRVPGDGAAVRVFVGKSKLKATFELRALPKLHPGAFRVAELTNQLAWPLLPGRVDLFRSTGLVGRYGLERVAQGAPFTLTLGIEDSVRVKRVVVEEVKRDAGLFGGKKRFTYAYRFELANHGPAPVELIVADHLPVSELDDVSVAVGEKTTAGYQLGRDDGIAKWKVSLKSQERKSIDFAYRVDVPSSYDTGSL